MGMRRTRLISIWLCIIFLITACSGTETYKESKEIEIHAQLPVMKSIASSIPNVQVISNAADNYHRLNPKVSIILDYLPDVSTYTMQEYFNLLEDESLQDIILWPDMSYLQIIEEKNLMRDIVTLQTGSNIIDINQSILDRSTVNGKLLVLPFEANPVAINFNKKLFDAAKLDYPEGEWTWEQFREISSKLEESRPILPYEPYTLEILMGSNSKGLISPDGDTAVGYLDSPESVRMVQWLNAYYHDNEPEPFAVTSRDIFSQFDSGWVGMILGGYGFTSLNFMGDNRDNLGYAPLPHFEGSKRANPIGIQGFGISSKSEHPEAAWDFIQYLTLDNNEDSTKLAGMYITTSQSLAEKIGQNTDPIKSLFVDEMNYAVKSSSDYSPYYNVAWNEELLSQFRELLSLSEEQIPDRLHTLALKLDEEMDRLKLADERQE